MTDYFKALIQMPNVFLGVTKPTGYSDFAVALVLFLRLVFFEFFMSILVRRFSRR